MRKLKNAIATIRDTISQDGRYYKFGNDDKLPNFVIQDINDSSTAVACVERVQQFIIGKGLANEVKSIKVNKDENLADLFEQIALRMAFFKGFALQIKHDNSGNRASVHVIGVEHIRRRFDGQFIYDNLLGDESYSVFKTLADRKVIPSYDPKRSRAERLKIINKQIKDYKEQIGEIYYPFVKGVGVFYDKYAMPTCLGGLDFVKADGNLARAENNVVSESFRPSAIIVTGEIDDTQKDDDGKTSKDYFDENLQNFTGENPDPILHIMQNNEAQNVSVTAFNPKDIADAFAGAMERIPKAVCRTFGVPPVLVGIDTQGKLGDNQELVNKVKLFNLTIDERKQFINRHLKVVFPEVDSFVSPDLNIFEHLPDKVIDILTENELREMNNLPLKEEIPGVVNENDAGNVNTTLRDLTGRQHQNIERIERKFNNGQMTWRKAAMLLKSSYGFSDEQVVELIGNNPEIIEDGNN